MNPPSSGPTAAATPAAAPMAAYARFCASPVKLPWTSACIDGRSSDAPSPPITAQQRITGASDCASTIARAPTAYASSPITYARFLLIRSATRPPIRMNAADTSASSAIVDWTLLAVVPRSCTTAEMDTFMKDVSTTRMNIAAESNSVSVRPLAAGATRAGVGRAVSAAPAMPAHLTASGCGGHHADRTTAAAAAAILPRHARSTDPRGCADPAAARQLLEDARRLAARGGAGRRHAVQLGPLLPAARRPGRVAFRVLDDARRHGRGDRADRDRRAGHLQLLPQPEPARGHGPHGRPRVRRAPDLR